MYRPGSSEDPIPGQNTDIMVHHRRLIFPPVSPAQHTSLSLHVPNLALPQNKFPGLVGHLSGFSIWSLLISDRRLHIDRKIDIRKGKRSDSDPASWDGAFSFPFSLHAYIPASPFPRGRRVNKCPHILFSESKSVVEVGSCHFFLAIGGSLYGVFSGKLSFAEPAIPDIEYDVLIIKDSCRPHSHGVFVLE